MSALNVGAESRAGGEKKGKKGKGESVILREQGRERERESQQKTHRKRNTQADRE